MAEDNNVAIERLELLDQLADKQEEMRSKKNALTPVEQAMFTSILELPPDRQVITALRRFIQRMERKLSEMSVQTVPAAQKATTSASCNVAGACAAVAAAPATYPNSRGSSVPSGGGCSIGRRTRSILRMSVRQAHLMDPEHSTRQIHSPSEKLDLHEIHSPSEE